MPIFSSIMNRIDARGSTEERQVVTRWRAEINDFLTVFGTGIAAGDYSLILELSRSQEFTLTVKGRRESPTPRIALHASRWLSEPACSLALEAGTHHEDCRLSLRITPGACRYRLLVRDIAGEVGSRVVVRMQPPPLPVPLQAVHSWLVDDGLAIWLSSRRTPSLRTRLAELTARLSAQLGTPLNDQADELWEEHVPGQGHWVRKHTGIIFKAVSATVSARILSGMPPKSFACLATYQAYKTLTLVFDEKGALCEWRLMP